VRSAAVLVLLSLLAVPALTASNGIAPGSAGAGSAAISGYAVSSISYSLDGEEIDGVSFALAPAGARTVKARLAPDAPWSACTVEGASVSCPLAAPVDAAVALEVVASS
jgi:hypothetical protein